MKITDIKIPNDLLKDIKVLCHMLDNYENIEKITIDQDFAELIKPYSTRIANGDYSINEGINPTLYNVRTSLPKDMDMTNNDWSEEYHDDQDFDDLFNVEVSKLGHNNHWGRTPLFWLKEAYYDLNHEDRLNPKTLIDILSDPAFLRIWSHIQFAGREYTVSRHKEGFSMDNFLSTLLASALPQFENELWSNDNLLTDKYYSEYALAGKCLWKDQMTLPIMFKDRDGTEAIGLGVIFLLEDKIVRFNILMQNTVYKKDYPSYEILEFTDDVYFKEYDQPGTPEGFLLVKIMEI